jgi:hypothetical protein
LIQWTGVSLLFQMQDFMFLVIVAFTLHEAKTTFLAWQT